MNTLMNKLTQRLAVVLLFLIFLGIPEFGLAAVEEQTVAPESIVSNQLEMSFIVSEPVQDNDTSPDVTEEISVIVDTGNGSVVSSAAIKRTMNTDGTKRDEVTFNADQAKETVENAKASGQKTVRIVIPDPNDEVSQLDITIPRESAAELASSGLNLEIYTDNAKIVIPNDSLQGLTDNLYFRVVPIKDETQRTEVEERARVEQMVKEVAGDNRIQVVARPMTIETNLSSRAVDIVLPLRNVTLPTDEQEREAFLADLVIFIEHSDGDRQLVKPEVVDYSGGQLGLKFGVNKFSTFTILNMEGWGEYLKTKEASKHHDAYMEGYPDQTFKPDRGVSRAEMAMILYRIEAGATREDGHDLMFSDVSANHWAQPAIRYVSSKGLMVGYPDETFNPEQSITRAEMATIVRHWLELQEDANATFNDTLGHWAEKDISNVQQAGIIEGLPDGSFQPDKPLTRAEAVTMMNKILKRGSQDWTISTWRDVPSTHWALKNIEEASHPHQFTKNIDDSESIVK
ncbi:hypothetical protein PAESOLCIP111_03038 [Paenibacillus solanacearum]|uniref:SLH domain-containing protein n=1 Tax=Paenibacillus solanacearum TaxID=2048548 RepID=A0A916K1T0_9BACL|nr:S-layer homology domain-containing protein [Paenibacillus solanacearum]CAG7628765.1 hypothetical protein PAESOLCIP111_03038 [Paenibacillus solanacearum]